MGRRRRVVNVDTAENTNSKYDYVNKLTTDELHTELQKLKLSNTGLVRDRRQRLHAFLENGLEYPENSSEDAEIKTPDLTNTPVMEKQNKIRCPPVGDIVQRWNHVFNGKTDAVAFLERLEELQETHGFSNEQLLTALPQMLQDTALLWYRNNKRDIKEWEDFIELFKIFFLPSDYIFNLEEEINNRKQRIGEKGKDFIIALQTLIRRHDGYSSAKALHKLYQNLRIEYKLHIQRSTIKSLADLLREIEDYEKLEQEVRRNNSRNPGVFKNPNPTERNTVTPVTNINRTTRNHPFCFKCGDDDHIATSCQNPRKVFCIKCRKPGRFSRDCCEKEKFKSDESALEHDSFEILASSNMGQKKKKKEIRPFLYIQIGDKIYQALIDTGSVSSFINEKVAKQSLKWGAEKFNTSFKTVLLADGTTTNINEAYRVSCIINNNSTELEVGKIATLTPDIILGINMLKKLKLSINMVTDEIELVSCNSPKENLNLLPLPVKKGYPNTPRTQLLKNERKSHLKNTEEDDPLLGIEALLLLFLK